MTTRSRTVLLGQSPGRGVGLLGGVMALLVVLIALVVVIPLLIVGAVVAALAAGVWTIKSWLTLQRRPNGVLDGRKNVRVRLPAESGT